MVELSCPSPVKIALCSSKANKELGVLMPIVLEGLDFDENV